MNTIRKNDSLAKHLESIASQWKKYYKSNIYYHKDLERLAHILIPKDVSVIEFGCREGELLKSLPNFRKTGIECSQTMLTRAKKNDASSVYVASSYNQFSSKQKYEYILLSHTLSYIQDAQEFIKELLKISQDDTRIVIVSNNFLWKPFLDLAENLHWRIPQPQEPNWLSSEDISNIMTLEGYEKIKSGRRFLFPFKIPLVSPFLNIFLANVFPFNSLCLTHYIVFKNKGAKKEYSLSIIIPARNEAGTIKGVLTKIPLMSKKTETIFIEGHSTDDTYKTITDEIKNYTGPMKVSLFKQQGKGKKDATMLGFSKAKNDVLMVLDADLSVSPKELPKFFTAIKKGYADFVMGSRLVYPMEKQAMRTINYIGNKLFSLLFSYLLGQKVKDTLCGTKVLLRKDYSRIRRDNYFGDIDPFGDFDLIFGAAKLNLKIVEIPIRYKERVYGKTNISRFQHGFLLSKMTFLAAKKLRFV